MKVGIDATNIKSGGGAVHLVEIINRFSKIKDIEVVIWSNSIIAKSLIKSKNVNIIILHKVFDHPIIRGFWQLIALAGLARKLSCDILFFPGGSYIGAFKPFVSMSQNMLPFSPEEINRYGFSLRKIKLLILKYWQEHSFKKSQGIIFLSSYAKRIISNSIDISFSNHKVIHHGINKGFFQVNKRKFNKSFPKAVYVSTIDVYKHHEKVIKAVSNLKIKDGVNLQLDFIGSSYKPALKKVEKAIKTLNLSDSIKILGTIKNSDLPKRYEEYDFAIFASSCENQPITLLEKMASGLPICSSNMQPMPEVLGDGGIYFDPLNTREIEEAIKKLLTCEQSRSRISRLSKDLSKKYNWDNTAIGTLNFLREVSHTYKTGI